MGSSLHHAPAGTDWLGHRVAFSGRSGEEEQPVTLLGFDSVSSSRCRHYTD